MKLGSLPNSMEVISVEIVECDRRGLHICCTNIETDRLNMKS